MIPETPQMFSPGQRAAIASRSPPSMTSNFWRDEAPATIRTSRRETPSSSAMSRMSAMFAAPSTAGAPTRARSTPLTTPSTRSAAALGVRRTAKRTSAALKTSEGAPQEAEDDQDDEPGPVDHAALGQHPPDGREDRLGRLEEEARDLVAAGRVDPRHEHAPEDQRPERDQQELEEVREEGGTHEPSLPHGSSDPARSRPRLSVRDRTPRPHADAAAPRRWPDRRGRSWPPPRSRSRSRRSCPSIV